MPLINDREFGEIIVRRSALSKSLKATIAPDGRIRLSIPNYMPMIFAKRFVASSRARLRSLRQHEVTTINYVNGMQIGKSHHLEIRSAHKLALATNGTAIVLSKPESTEITSTEIQQLMRSASINALKKEAKSYLPRRTKFLADKHGFLYQTIRFSHASTRWGSCSSNGTISLNIALMKLPFELIDYVILHELAHTKHMNHSNAFWLLVASIEPRYKTFRSKLKQETPTI